MKHRDYILSQCFLLQDKETELLQPLLMSRVPAPGYLRYTLQLVSISCILGSPNRTKYSTCGFTNMKQRRIIISLTCWLYPWWCNMVSGYPSLPQRRSAELCSAFSLGPTVPFLQSCYLISLSPAYIIAWGGVYPEYQALSCQPILLTWQPCPSALQPLPSFTTCTCWGCILTYHQDHWVC